MLRPSTLLSLAFPLILAGCGTTDEPVVSPGEPGETGESGIGEGPPDETPPPSPIELYHGFALRGGLFELGLRSAAGDDLISGQFETALGAFQEGSLRLFGLTVPELEALDQAELERYVSGEVADRALALGDLVVIEESFPTRHDDEAEAIRQLCVALSGILHILEPERAAQLAATDHCTASPEIFPEACAAHDFCYSDCREGASRKGCDDAFRDDMGTEAEESSWKKPFVPVYYYAVRAFGWRFYECD